MADRPHETHLDDPVSFDSPPVSEVVLGVQFAGPVADDAVTLADFWPQIRERFPDMEKREALNRIDESFGPTAASQQVQINFGIEPPRYWFVSADKHWLVQVQPDRFIFNWRNRQGEHPYPRYRAIRRRFEDLYRTFADSVGEERLNANPPEWCATTYINNILASSATDPATRLPLGQILRFVATPKSSVLPPVEDTAIQQRHLLPPAAGENEPQGRFYIKANPAFRAEDHLPGYVLELKVLAHPDAHSRAAIMRCFDQGRGLIVRSFKDITTPAMHKQCGLQEDK